MALRVLTSADRAQMSLSYVRDTSRVLSEANARLCHSRMLWSDELYAIDKARQKIRVSSGPGCDGAPKLA